MIEQGPGNEDFWINQLYGIDNRLEKAIIAGDFYTQYLITESKPPPNPNSLSRRMTIGIFTQQVGDDRAFFPVFVPDDNYKKELTASALTFLALMVNYVQSFRISLEDNLVAARYIPDLSYCDKHNEPVAFAYFGYENRKAWKIPLPSRPFITVSTIPGYEFTDAMHDLLLMGMSVIDKI